MWLSLINKLPHRFFKMKFLFFFAFFVLSKARSLLNVNNVQDVFKANDISEIDDNQYETEILKLIYKRDVEGLKKKLVKSVYCFKRFLPSAVDINSYEMVKLLLENGYTCYSESYPKVVTLSVINNNPSIFELLHQYNINERGNDDQLYMYALRKHGFEMAELIKKHGYALSPTCYLVAVIDRNYDGIKWLMDNDCPKDSRAVTSAVGMAFYQEMYKFLLENGFPCDVTAFLTAASKKRLDVVDYLVNHKCPYNCQPLETAAEEKNLELMQWLHNKMCPLSEKIMNTSVIVGDFQILNWLKENNCPWSIKTMYIAAERSDLSVVKWLKESGCTCNCWSVKVAKTFKRVDIEDYLIRSGCNDTCDY